jgi:hypothetical protein
MKPDRLDAAGALSLPAACGWAGGVAFAALVGLPRSLLDLPLTCADADQCTVRARLVSTLAIAILLLFALAFGVSVRAVAEWHGRRRQDRATAGPPPAWAIGLAVPLFLFALLGGPFGAWLGL